MCNQLLNLSQVNLSNGSFMPHPTALNKIVFSIIKDVRDLIYNKELCTITSENYDAHSGNNRRFR